MNEESLDAAEDLDGIFFRLFSLLIVNCSLLLIVFSRKNVFPVWSLHKIHCRGNIFAAPATLPLVGKWYGLHIWRGEYF